jgi:hypothetical protein
LVFSSETALGVVLGSQCVPDDDVREVTNVAAAAAVCTEKVWEATMATWIKCTSTKHEAVYVNLDNVVTVTRNDAADRISERGTVISFMGGEQVYIVVNEQPEDIIGPPAATALAPSLTIA